MPASVSFRCDCCSHVKGCKIKPENLFKTMDRKSGWCFTSKKVADANKDAVWGNKKRGRKKKLNKPVKEETEDANA